MIKKKTVTITIRELFFYLFFAVMFGMRMWGIYEGKPAYGILLVIGFVLWGLSMLMNEHTLLEFIVIALLMGVAGLVYINTGEKGLLLYFALMLGMKGVDTRRLFKVGIVVGGFGMITLTFLASFGIIEDVAYVQPRANLGFVFRRSLGYPHPNTLSTSFTILVMMIMFVVGYKDRAKLWKTSIILFLLAAYIYLYSGSRTGIIMTIGYLLLNIFGAYRTRLNNIEKILIAAFMPLLWFVSIILPTILPDESLQTLVQHDGTFAARWTVGRYYLTYNSVSLFGCRLNNPKPEIDGLDMSQLYLFLQLGLLAFLIVSILWVLLLFDQVKHNKINELAITLILLFMGITDPFLYNLGFKNLSFIFMGALVFRHFEIIEKAIPIQLKKRIRLIQLGNCQIEIPSLALSNRIKNNRNAILAYVIGTMIIAGLAFSYYHTTNDIEIILADIGPGEPKVFMAGNDSNSFYSRTFSENEIESLKKQGTLVLNYTDENEPMYTYYTDENNPIEGALYAPVAGKLEIFRKSVSIFIWISSVGLLLMRFIVYLREKQE